MSTVVSEPKLLIGEGVEECSFFGSLLKHMRIANIQIENYGGKDNLKSYLRSLKLVPGYRDLISLGITRDADQDSDAAFQSVCTALSRAGLSIPSKVGHLVGSNPQVSVFILPGHPRSGMLEDICLDAASVDPGMKCVDQYFECIYRVTNRQPNNLSKARIHAWLASQLEPDKRLGEAAKANQNGDYWSWDHPAFDQLKQFLRSL